MRAPKFHFLVFSNEEINFAKIFGQTEKHGEWLDCQTFPLSPRVAEVFGAGKPFCVLLRPDNHVGFVSERISAAELKNYPFLNRVFEE